MLKALIFDFDGLILDTETPLLRSWQEVFAAHQVAVTTETVARLVEMSREPPEAYRLLKERLGPSMDPQAIRRVRLRREAELIAGERARPGVERLLGEARRAGVRTAVASSSPIDWVGPHLARLGLAAAFDSLRCRDDVGQVKPDPQLYAAVLADLGVDPGEALAFEDSPAGAEAARRAGVFCIALPNPATAGLAWGPIGLRLPTLESVSLEELAGLLRARGSST
jgi:HAD superfamily hydrolase (TIGR01509 family)